MNKFKKVMAGALTCMVVLVNAQTALGTEVATKNETIGGESLLAQEIEIQNQTYELKQHNTTLWATVALSVSAVLTVGYFKLDKQSRAITNKLK